MSSKGPGKSRKRQNHPAKPDANTAAHGTDNQESYEELTRVLAENPRVRQLVTQEFFHHSGPLPPSQELAGYEATCPGAADRIIGMAERQAEHRQSIEGRVVWFKSIQSALGTLVAGSICLFALYLGGQIILDGKSAAGLVAMLTPLGAVAGAFVYGKSSQMKELRRKNTASEPNSHGENDE